MTAGSESGAIDIVERLKVERPWLNIDESENLIASWFRVALREHAKSADAFAFVPFADAFSGFGFSEGFERFMRREKHILETSETSNISAGDFEELLRVEMVRHLGASGGAFSVFQTVEGPYLSETAFQHFDVLMRLDPEAAMRFAADSVTQGHFFADRQTKNGTPAPLRLVNHCPEIGVGFSPETRRFHRNLLDWCLKHLGQEDARATAGQLLPVVFRDIKTTSETEQKAAEQQADFLVSLLKPLDGLGTILGQIELQIDQEYEEGFGKSLETVAEQMSSSLAPATKREFSRRVLEIGNGCMETSRQCFLTNQFLQLQEEKPKRPSSVLKLSGALLDVLNGGFNHGTPAHNF